ncbi:hypothetical protein BD94_2752 [Elizabethkingia anophelis NUHP1]|uniref:Uncharacterized protein n=1 Tax=Elizabethkingia anophelis NUHP1 TaxID=1338011 RepID=A0A077EGD6_9FLAO|nr:hypothetical protein BD94_2752 [Elizabethkingia anophelis NUHP1]KMU61913.1 hypothetical protein EZBTHKR_2497 [Elizabethkingia anophelis]
MCFSDVLTCKLYILSSVVLFSMIKDTEVAVPGTKLSF